MGEAGVVLTRKDGSSQQGAFLRGFPLFPGCIFGSSSRVVYCLKVGLRYRSDRGLIEA